MSKNKNRNYFENKEESDMSNEQSPIMSSSTESSSSISSVTSKTVAAKVDVTPSVTSSTTISATPKKAEPAVTPAMAKLKASIEKYESVVLNKSTSAKANVDLFYGIVVAVVSCSEPAVYDEFYKYFFSHRETTMTNINALKGIHRLTDANKKSTVSAFYAIFFAMVRAKVERVGFHLSIKAIRRAIRNENFVNWIISKMQ